MAAAPPPVSAPATITAPTTPAPVSAPWYGEIADPDLKGWAELKKPGDAATALRGWRDSEKLLGVPKNELARIPKPDAKPEEWEAFYKAVGRPDTPDAYDIPVIEGGEPFKAAMAPVLHSAGLSQSQVTKIAEAYNGFIKGAVDQQEREQGQREALDLQHLHQEWPGEVFEQRQEMARRAVREFVTPIVGDDTANTLGAIEDAIGTAKFLKLFSSIGEKVGEPRFIGNEQPSNFGMTPAAAKARLDELRGDKEWGAKVLSNPGGPEGREWNRLIELASKR